MIGAVAFLFLLLLMPLPALRRCIVAMEGICCLALSFGFHPILPMAAAEEVHELAFSNGDEETYRQMAIKILDLEEREMGRSLGPGPRRRVGIKVYTASGLGLETPKQLTAGVIDALLARGFRSDEIFILDDSSFSLWECGYLPHPFPAKSDKTFHGVAVCSLTNDHCYDEHWFYDCPLSRRPTGPVRPPWSHEGPNHDESSGRRSYLPVALFFDVDFWINLPRLRADRTLTVSAAVANGTIFNMTNGRRFFGNPKHAATAMVDVLSIPEFRRIPVIHILDLTRFQVIEQNVYRAYFCGSTNRLIFGRDPFSIDYRGWQILNRERRRFGMPDLPLPEFFHYRPMDGGQIPQR